MKPAPSLADLYARSQDAVAYVQTQKGSGSGFLVSKNGQIVTNEHVVDGASRVTVRFGEHGKALPARVVGQDARTTSRCSTSPTARWRRSRR